ncbi:MAG: carbohydrate ABC transporter permease [Clostridiales bacterium]|nr:carbohydrate ABC transporter permease [Clostridiales bacterium]
MQRESNKRKKRVEVFDVVNIVILFFFTLVIAYPLYFVLIASVSAPTAVNSGQVWLWPVNANFNGYSIVMQSAEIWRGYLVTAALTVLGTLINLALTLTGAYALTKTHLPGIRPIMFLFTFTMFFSGGLIPTYLLVSSLGMRDTIWALILPGAVSMYNIILVRTFYRSSIPNELLDAAVIDGCSEIKTLLRVVLPLSKPIVATMALFYGVGHWNQYFQALIYIRDKNLYTLQLVIRNLLLESKNLLNNLVQAGGMGMSQEYLSEVSQRAETLKYAVIVVSTLPVLLVYPLLQKHLVRGIMIGSLKG